MGQKGQECLREMGEEQRQKEQTQDQIKISRQESHVTGGRRKNSGKSQSYRVSQGAFCLHALHVGLKIDYQPVRLDVTMQNTDTNSSTLKGYFTQN